MKTTAIIISWIPKRRPRCFWHTLQTAPRTRCDVTTQKQEEIAAHWRLSLSRGSVSRKVCNHCQVNSMQEYRSQGSRLADFSSSLIRLYDRMESAASIDESEALAQMKDSTLKERFITGVKDQHCQRELRRTALSNPRMYFSGFQEGSSGPLPTGQIRRWKLKCSELHLTP